MPTMLTHILVHPDRIARWEEILRILVARTHAEEPSVQRYEYWRGQEAGRYYALLSYPDASGFYAHQGSEYHDEYLADFEAMFADIRMEWVDPVANGGSGLAPTEADPLPDDAPERHRRQVPLYPIAKAEWWAAARAEGGGGQ